MQANTLSTDAQAILSSPYLSGQKEYGSDGRTLFQSSWIDSSSYVPSHFTFSDLQNEIQHAIDDSSSPIFGPGSSNSITTSPIYVVVTDPSQTSDQPGASASNEHGAYNGQPINMIWAGTSSSSTEDNFGLNFSHEMAEDMSDPTQSASGVLVRTFGLPAAQQIADGEQESYSYRLNGILGDYNLSVHSDPFGPLHDNIVLDTTSAGGVQVSVNTETATFDPGQIQTTNVITDRGTNYIDVRSTPNGVRVYLSGGGGSTDTVTLGKSGSVAGIQGQVFVSNAGGHTALVLDDSSDTAAHGVSITKNSVLGLLAFREISYTAPTYTGGPGVTSVTIRGGQAPAGSVWEFDVLTTSAFAPVTISGGANSQTVVDVGGLGTNRGGGSLDDILGAVNVFDVNGQLTLIVDDGSDGTAHSNVVVTASSVTGLSQGAINYTAGSNGDGVTAVTVYAGNGADNITVESTGANAPVTVNAGTGADAISLGGLGYGSLAGLLAGAAVNGHGGGIGDAEFGG
jgi:hypothetical protein